MAFIIYTLLTLLIFDLLAIYWIIDDTHTTTLKRILKRSLVLLPVVIIFSVFAHDLMTAATCIIFLIYNTGFVMLLFLSNRKIPLWGSVYAQIKQVGQAEFLKSLQDNRTKAKKVSSILLSPFIIFLIAGLLTYIMFLILKMTMIPTMIATMILCAGLYCFMEDKNKSYAPFIAVSTGFFIPIIMMLYYEETQGLYLIYPIVFSNISNIVIFLILLILLIVGIVFLLKKPNKSIFIFLSVLLLVRATVPILFFFFQANYDLSDSDTLYRLLIASANNLLWFALFPIYLLRKGYLYHISKE